MTGRLDRRLVLVAGMAVFLIGMAAQAGGPAFRSSWVTQWKNRGVSQDASPPRRAAIWCEIALVLVVLFVIVIAAQVVLHQGGSWLAHSVTSWVAYLLMAMVVALAFRRADISRRDALGTGGTPLWRQALTGVLIAVALVMVVVGLPAVLGVPVTDLTGTRPGGLTQIAVSIATSVLLVGPVEEFCFRGYLLSRLQGVMRHGWAVVVQAAVFGLWHLPAAGSLPQVGFATLIGLALGVLRWRLRGASVVAVGLGHGLYDGALTVLARLVGS